MKVFALVRGLSHVREAGGQCNCSCRKLQQHDDNEDHCFAAAGNARNPHCCISILYAESREAFVGVLVGLFHDADQREVLGGDLAVCFGADGGLSEVRFHTIDARGVDGIIKENVILLTYIDISQVSLRSYRDRCWRLYSLVRHSFRSIVFETFQWLCQLSQSPHN